MAPLTPKQKQFSTINDPLALKGNRAVINPQKDNSPSRRLEMNSGATNNNPKHEPSNKLERIQHSTKAYTPDGPTMHFTGKPRENINHSSYVNRESFHANCGTSKKADSFRGRRK